MENHVIYLMSSMEPNRISAAYDLFNSTEYHGPITPWVVIRGYGSSLVSPLDSGLSYSPLNALGD